MRTSILVRRSIAGLIIIAAIAIAFALALTASAQAPAPTSTPDPTLVALEGQVSVLSTEVALLNAKVDLNKEAVQVQASKELLPWFAAAAALAILGIVSIASPLLFARAAAKRVEDRTNERLDKAIYRADATYQLIHLPYDRQDLFQRLSRLGFERINFYRPTALTKHQLEGIVVYPATTEQEVQDLEHFIKKESADPAKVAYIILTPGRLNSMSSLSDHFPMAVSANYTSTLTMHVWTMARILAGTK